MHIAISRVLALVLELPNWYATIGVQHVEAFSLYIVLVYQVVLGSVDLSFCVHILPRGKNRS